MENDTMRGQLSPKTNNKSGSRESVRLAVNIPLDLIRTGRFLQNLSLGRGMRALVRSIEKNGVRSPIYVSAENNGTYELITGKRRVAAAKKAGLKEIPAVVYNPGTGDPGLIKMMSEGFAGMHFLDEAENFRNIMETMEVSQAELARVLGKSQGYISNRVRMLTLTPAVRRLIKDGGVSERHVREVMKIFDDKLQKAVVKKIIENELTVTQTEETVEAVLRDSDQLRRKLARKLTEYENWNRALENSSNELVLSDKRRQLARVIKSSVDIGRKNGLQVQAGQVNTSKYFEMTIRIMKEEHRDTAENTQKAA